MLRVLLVALALGVSAYACSDGEGSGDQLSAISISENWVFRASVTDEFEAGEFIPVEVQLKNESGEPQVLTPDCVSAFRLTVLNEDGISVFDWYDRVIETEYGGEVPQCPLGHREMAPGESLRESIGFLVKRPGRYTVQIGAPGYVFERTLVDFKPDLTVAVRAR